jgi:pimeloyl-ACP methyl ester carboxylesterase
METPDTHYATSGDVSIAYQVMGSGPFDVVWVQGFVSNVELAWQQPTLAAFNRGLAGICRLIRFDKRGTGMSDRVGVATLETRMDDVRAVMDAAGSSRAGLLGSSEGGPLSLLFAASYPGRTLALMLWSSFARYAWAPDVPWGLSEKELRDELDDTLRSWNDLELMVKMVEASAPNIDRQSKLALGALWRQSASPRDVEALTRMCNEIDVRHVLPAISTPTLVMNRAGEEPVIVEGSRYLAEHIAGARHVQFPGGDHMIAAGDTEPVLREIELFLGAAWEADETSEPNRFTTVLFSDIVGSSATAAALGDRAWRELLERHHELVRRHLVRFRGKEIDTAGDGFFASCGYAIAAAMPELGLQVRVGLHTGECELVDGKAAGIAVHTGARVATLAQPGEVLVSRTVKDLVAGSGIELDDRGEHDLKGIPGIWQLFAVRAP